MDCLAQGFVQDVLEFSHIRDLEAVRHRVGKLHLERLAEFAVVAGGVTDSAGDRIGQVLVQDGLELFGCECLGDGCFQVDIDFQFHGIPLRGHALGGVGASVSADSQRWPKPAFQRFGWPGLSSPRPAGRCLAVEAQAHRVRGRAGAWLSCFARPPSRGRAA
ncbi:hypothetical protein D3C71_1140540 [compost metagenome]